MQRERDEAAAAAAAKSNRQQKESKGISLVTASRTEKVTENCNTESFFPSVLTPM